MEQILRALILDDETVHINGHSYTEKSAIVDILQKELAKCPDLTISIEPEQMSLYRAIGKVIYASQIAGANMLNMRFKNKDGSYFSAAGPKQT